MTIKQVTQTALKGILDFVSGGYAPYFIYGFEANRKARVTSPSNAAQFEIRTVGQTDVESAEHPKIREQAWYAGPGSRLYGCYEGDQLVGLCAYWYGERYRQRNFWPLRESEAKLVQVITVPEVRGRGVASQLIARSAVDMLNDGFSRLYARIWHSNRPSIKAFEKANWGRIALVVEMNPLRRKQPLKVRIPL